MMEETDEERINRKYYSDIVCIYTDLGHVNPYFQGDET